MADTLKARAADIKQRADNHHAALQVSNPILWNMIEAARAKLGSLKDIFWTTELTDGCDDLLLKFDYNNITSQLCDPIKNPKSKILEDKIKTEFPNFNIKSYFKFNNSIIKLDANNILMTYRIYLTKIKDCTEFDIGKCHYWNYNWGTEWDTFEKLGISFNHIGLCIIDINTYTVLKDTLLTIKDKPSGFEDVRLFEFNETIYISGTVLAGWSKKPSKTGGKQHVARQAIAKLGSKEDLLNALPNSPEEIEYDCLRLHTSGIEKNWFGYTNKDNKHVIVNPSFGTFFPLNQAIINFNEKEQISNNWKQNYLGNNFKSINSYKCDIISPIKEKDIMLDINKAYTGLLKNSAKPDLFRLSGGSWGIPYDGDTVLFVGHIVAYPALLDFQKTFNYIEKNPETQLSKNLIYLLAKRNYQITMRYFQIFFTINMKDNTLERISHAYSVFKTPALDTAINFPVGLVNIGSKYIISFGESDYNAVLLTLEKSELERLFTNVTPADFKIITYDSTSKPVCYKIHRLENGQIQDQAQGQAAFGLGSASGFGGPSGLGGHSGLPAPPGLGTAAPAPWNKGYSGLGGPSRGGTMRKNKSRNSSHRHTKKYNY